MDGKLPSGRRKKSIISKIKKGPVPGAEPQTSLQFSPRTKTNKNVTTRIAPSLK